LLRGRDQKRITKGTREFLTLSKAECEVTAMKRFDDGCLSGALLIIPTGQDPPKRGLKFDQERLPIRPGGISNSVHTETRSTEPMKAWHNRLLTRSGTERGVVPFLSFARWHKSLREMTLLGNPPASLSDWESQPLFISPEVSVFMRVSQSARQLGSD
jgi:hypothetical protein